MQKRIFVSATNRDLESYRRLASESLRKRRYEVDDQAVFNLTFLEIYEKLERRIEACDAVVCLIGFAYGGEPSNRPPDQPRRSYTQWEYFLARELKKPVYLLMADERTPFDPDPRQPESDELPQLQLRYRAEAEPLYRRSVQIMILFQRRTGHEHRNGRPGLNNYRGLLQALGKTTDQIEQQLRELDESLRSEGS